MPAVERLLFPDRYDIVRRRDHVLQILDLLAIVKNPSKRHNSGHKKNPSKPETILDLSGLQSSQEVTKWLNVKTVPREQDVDTKKRNLTQAIK
jgi:hypothetical protein